MLQEKTHNTLIHRGFTPPLWHCVRVSYNILRGAFKTLPRTCNPRVGRVLPFMLFSLFMVPVFTGCGKEDAPQGHASAESYAPWGGDTAVFWSKQTSAIGATTTNI